MRPAALTGLVLALGAAFAAGWLVRDATDETASAPTAELPTATPTDARPTTSVTHDEGGDAPRAGAAPAPRAETAAPQRKPVEPARGGRALSPEERVRSGFPASISEAFAKRAPGGPPLLDGELDAAADAAAKWLDGLRRGLEVAPGNIANSIARDLADRAAARATFGSLEGEGEVVLQARGNNASVEFLHVPDARICSATPLDVTTAPDGIVPGQVFRSGGVPPYGTVFVVDRVTVTASLGDDRTADTRIDSPFFSSSPFRILRRGTTRAVLTGSLRWDTLQKSGTSVRTQGCAAGEIRIHGRVMPVADAPPDVALTADLEQSAGYLKGDFEVRLQVAAAHGGGNEVRLRLDGTDDGRVDEWRQAPVWDDGADLVKRPRSAAWTGGTGLIPPGHHLRIRRIDWRVKRGVERAGTEKAEMNGSARMALPSVEAFRIERPSRKKGEAIPPEFESGTWTGDVTLRPGEEQRVEFGAAYYTMAEAVVSGTVEPDAKR